MILAALLATALDVRPVLVVNAGDEAILSFRVGNASTSTWSDDVLGFDDVIEVSKGRVLRIPYDRTNCIGDVQATYRDGSVVVKRDLDLCTVERIDFR